MLVSMSFWVLLRCWSARPLPLTQCGHQERYGRWVRRCCATSSLDGVPGKGGALTDLASSLAGSLSSAVWLLITLRTLAAFSSSSSSVGYKTSPFPFFPFKLQLFLTVLCGLTGLVSMVPAFQKGLHPTPWFWRHRLAKSRL